MYAMLQNWFFLLLQEKDKYSKNYLNKVVRMFKIYLYYLKENGLIEIELNEYHV